MMLRYFPSNSLKISSSSSSSSSLAVSLISLIPLLCLSILSINNSISGVYSALLPDLKPAEIGGCYDVIDNILVYCAAVDEECDGINATSRVRFKTAKEIESILPAQSWCTTDTLPVGTCKSTGQCALTKHACDDQNELEYRPHYHNLYEGTTTLCNAHGKFVEGRFQPTQYGACKDGSTGDITCVLSPSDCKVHEEWISANEAINHKKNGCRCHDVRIGVCQAENAPASDSSSSTCAISPDDCLILQKFQPARVVMEQMVFLDCRLCPYDTLLVTTPVAAVNLSGNKGQYEGHGGSIFMVMFGILISVVAFCVVLKYYDNETYGKEPIDVTNPSSVEITNSSSAVVPPPPDIKDDLPYDNIDSYESEFSEVIIDDELPKIT